MIVTIHQPEHLPWLGFFHKASQADCIVILDNVQFRKNYFQNRNKIRTQDGWQWITVPVIRSLDTLIRDVAISDEPRWKEKWWNAVYLSYKRGKFFDRYENELREALDTSAVNLCALNVSLLRFAFKVLGINARMVFASELGAEGKSGELILDICKKIKADSYFSGISGREYLDLDAFKNAGINVSFQEFHHPIYSQLHAPFLPCMSVADLIFNHGPQSMKIINGEGVEVMAELFL
ncbi:MAG: WbqC family protein [Candidatus Omnitrophica bacterium]|nr:WbqC family protein [Candidatus Omnitrophota bacterium]